MNKKQLEKEHAHVKEVLAEENDFINSKEYFELSDMMRNLHTVKKSALETYLKVLSIELWGKDTSRIDMSSMLLAGLISSVLSPSNFGGSAIPSTHSSEEQA
ncbi:MAG: hypothetical protein IJQ13_04570 [Prevotella sp.]|nr:hypothetical protein [Prevotella sp.]